MAVRWSLPAVAGALLPLLPLLQLPGSAALSLKESLLCEARTRLGVWYKDQDRLQWPKERDGVTLQITRHDVQCGGNRVPVTFGSFDVDAHPYDVFNAIADTSTETEWDSLAGSITQLGDWQGEAVRGVQISFNAHPFSDREVFEWQTCDGNPSEDQFDMWVVFSTLANDELHSKKERESGAVAAQDCLAAYHVQGTKTGGVHVTFTSHVNSHPFLLSSSFVFNIMWGKTVDYIDALRNRAQELARRRGDAPPRLGVPPWLCQRETNPSIEAPFSCDSPSQMFEVVGDRLPATTPFSWRFMPLIYIPGLLVIGAVLAVGPGRRLYLSSRHPERRLRTPADGELLQAESRDIEAETLLPGSAAQPAAETLAL